LKRRSRGFALFLAGAALLASLAGSGCASDEEKRTEHLSRADAYLAAGKDREALLELRNALKLDPQNAEINYRIGETAERLGAYTDAIYYYGEAGRLDPADTRAPLAEARLQIGDDPKRAEELIDGVLKRDPDNVLALMRLCDLELSRRRVKAATKAVMHALKVAPDDYRVHLQRGILLRAKVRNAQLRKNEPPAELSEEALAAFDRGIALMNDETPPAIVVRAWLERARVYASWPEHEKDAEAAFRKAAEVADRWPQLKLRPEVYRATLEWAQGSVAPDVQRWALQGLLALAPDDYGAWMELARLEGTSGGSEVEVMKKLADERPADANAQVYYARALDRNDRHADAVAHLEKSADATDEPAIALGTLVDMEVTAGELDAADKVAERMGKDFPNTPHTLFAQAQTALARGRAQEAVERLEKIQGGFDLNRVQTLTSEAEIRLGHPEKALAALNRAIELSGETPPIWLIRRRARILALQKDWGGVIRTFRGIAKRLGGKLNRDDILLLTTAFYETDRSDEGRRQLEALLASDDPPPEAALEFARREGARDPAKAEQVLEKALESHPENTQVLAQLVQNDLAKKRYDAALARIDALIATYPKSPALALLRGQVLASKGDLAGASEWGAKALDLAPGLEAAAQFQAGVLARQNRTDEAIATLEAQARVGSLGLGGTVLLGRLQAAQGNRERAIELFEKALAQRSDLPQVKNDLAYLLLDKGVDLERAFSLAQEAQASLPESPVAADTLGVAYLRRNLPGPAAEQLRYAIRLADKAGEVRPVFQYHLGLALRALGDTEQAKVAFEKALAVAVDFPEAASARQALDELRAPSSGGSPEAGSS
jgi:tetratricopeptide (TPR) repeat protein